ncbi:hypothetical protein ACFY93_22480 [Streptomyces sp. NPDC008313]|uniref:hypothetical protein n=1 Tax=Streptomyces sp. NPDC008313 TaxID=3364826 RepID=UPI0036DFBDCD
MGQDGRQFKSPNPHYAKAKEIADCISFAVLRAQEVDARYCAALKELEAAPGLRVDTKTWADVASDIDTAGASAMPYLKDAIPLDGSPRDVKMWWDDLTSGQRDEYVSAFPGLIGNLDGIPAEVREAVPPGTSPSVSPFAPPAGYSTLPFVLTL